MRIVNKNIKRKFEVLEKYEAGIVLTGPEVKTIKGGRLNMRTSYIKFIGNDLYWINASIPQYIHASDDSYDPERSRKLLLSKQELIKLKSKLAQRKNLTIVPLQCYTIRNLIKLEIALSKGKKLHDIKSLEKKREIQRKQKKDIKEYLKH